MTPAEQSHIEEIAKALKTMLSRYAVAPPIHEITGAVRGGIGQLLLAYLHQALAEDVNVEMDGDDVKVTLGATLCGVMRAIYGDNVFEAAFPDCQASIPGWVKSESHDRVPPFGNLPFVDSRVNRPGRGSPQ